MAEKLLQVFNSEVKLAQGISDAADHGYAFVPYGISSSFTAKLEAESNSLELELGDHIAEPIYQGTKKQITQMHARAYLPIDSPEVPEATRLADELAKRARDLIGQYPQLANWRTNEAGYQLYQDRDHHISKHRDRRNDQFLAATITIFGAACIGIYEPIDDPDDYTNTRQVDECYAEAGTVMFLRAAGLASGEQVIHDVSPPIGGPRLILNLRMRPVEQNELKILPQPSEKTQ